MDVLQPKANGWSFLNQLKADPATKWLPVIRVFVPDQKSKHEAMGAADSLAKPVARENLLAQGFDAYLSKPIEIKQLLQLIQGYIG